MPRPHNKRTQEQFIEVANKKHNNFYSYDKVMYVNSDIKVTITCPLHGDYTQAPSMHLAGQNCPECAIIKRSKKRASTKEQFIHSALKVHKFAYNYSEVVYTNNSTKVTITCNSCQQAFTQSPTDHLGGHGCPYCAKSYISVLKPITFYIIRLIVDNIELFKIGLTNHSAAKRYIYDNKYKYIDSIVLETCFLDSYDAVLFEQQIKQKLKPYRYKEIKPLFTKTKNSEVFTINPQPLVQQSLAATLKS